MAPTSTQPFLKQRKEAQHQWCFNCGHSSTQINHHSPTFREQPKCSSGADGNADKKWFPAPFVISSDNTWGVQTMLCFPKAQSLHCDIQLQTRLWNCWVVGEDSKQISVPFVDSHFLEMLHATVGCIFLTRRIWNVHNFRLAFVIKSLTKPSQGTTTI